jgi:ABC-type Mn2+/Zn2+ transport system permease subunit
MTTLENTMDIVFLAGAIIAGLLLPRVPSYLATVAVWALCLAMVGWGPAHNSDVHTREAGFWIPWLVVLAIGAVLVTVIQFFRERRAARSAS